jgi:hypothetical protein
MSALYNLNNGPFDGTKWPLTQTLHELAIKFDKGDFVGIRVATIPYLVDSLEILMVLFIFNLNCL